MYGKAYTLKKGSFSSADGVSNVAYYVFVPYKEPTAILQISHGMSEYLMRYEPFADYLCERGVVVCGNDHIGHGNTAPDNDSLGYIPCNGADMMVADLKKMTDLIRAEYGGLPHILLGHSMGSFLAREYLAQYKDSADAAIISGTAGPESPTGAGKLAAKLNIKLFGERNRSEFIYKLAFGSYSKKYPKGSSEYLWLSRDEDVQEAYAEDKFCGFRFTSAAYCALFDLLGRVSKKKWADKINKDTPILMISGDMDPVGNYGKGVMKIYDRLREAGVREVSLKLYADGHHEMLNEINRYEVFADILAWLNYYGFVKENY